MRMVIASHLLAGIALLAAFPAHALVETNVKYEYRATGMERVRTVSLARVDHHLRGIEPELIALRRDLHRHPELSGEESRTAGVIARRLRSLGLDVRTGVGGHGVVGILRGARPGPRVALRADMDAFPSDARDPVAFRSAVPGKRHICGHDVHVAVALGVAAALADQRRWLPGTVVFVFQPAEERATGARAMLADSVFRDGLPRAIYALHTAPLEMGTMGSKPGVLLAGRDGFTIELSATGGSLADAVRAVEETIRGLDTLERGPALFTPQDAPFRVGQALRSTGDAGGTRWTLQGRLAVSSDSLRDDAERRLREAVEGLAARGVRGTVDYRRREIAGIANDPTLEEKGRGVLRAVIGADQFVPVTRVVPAFSEDFGSFQSVVPGVMFWLGVANAKKGIPGMPHSPDYVADEDAILVGARAMSAVLLDALR
jgi:metal-dependent amidase/aminoacylase/carboxypeptidase family protein